MTLDDSGATLVIYFKFFITLLNSRGEVPGMVQAQQHVAQVWEGRSERRSWGWDLRTLDYVQVGQHQWRGGEGIS